MMKFRHGTAKHIFTMWLALVMSPALAGTAPAVQVEINAMLDNLARSGCEFQRNGTWYSGERASQHLARKLEYIEQRGGVISTEQFIDLAATQSSMSGKPYRVHCAGSLPIPSKTWLLDSLNRQRGSQSSPTGVRNQPAG